jgi:predicted TPR repeat methyltransferase
MPGSEPSRELTLEEAIAIAILLTKNGQLDEAQKLFAAILETTPDNPEALHYAGVLAHRQGRSGEATALIARSLALVPDRADWLSNLGIVFQEQGKLDDAIGAYRRAIALDASHANAHSNLGALLRAAGRPDEAEAAYRTAIRSDPAHLDAYTNLGILLTALGRHDEAAACFCKAITLRPKHREARRLMALAHCTIGEIDKAVQIFEEWLAEEPGDPIATHMLAACTGNDVPRRASDRFVAMTFDRFADSFDAKLASLAYRAPALVAAMLEDSGRAPAKDLDALDAGCGTGLCGPLIAPYARSLTGVDLSAKMLVRARERNVYDVLVEGELTAYLHQAHDAFDLVVSADALVYFGALEEVAAAAAAALRPDGLFVFTLEDAAGRNAPRGYRLELHGRYSHALPYVERVLLGCGLTCRIAEAELRMESGAPVAGLVIRATKLRRSCSP